MTLLILLGGASGAVVAGEAYPLHARATEYLLHAEETAGEKNTVYILATLVDETGEVLVDETGEVLMAYGETAVIILHARPTDDLLHAEDTPILVMHARRTDTLLHAEQT